MNCFVGFARGVEFTARRRESTGAGWYPEGEQGATSSTQTEVSGSMPATHTALQA